MKFAIDAVGENERLHAAQLRVTHSPPTSFTTSEDEAAFHPNSVIGDFDHTSRRKYKKENLWFVRFTDKSVTELKIKRKNLWFVRLEDKAQGKNMDTRLHQLNKHQLLNSIKADISLL